MEVSKDDKNEKKVKKTRKKEAKKKELIEIKDTNEVQGKNEKIQVENEEKKVEINKSDLEKAEKKERTKKEVKSFFILLLIILVVGGATWYWYNFMYDGNKNQRKNNTKSEQVEDKNISFNIDTYVSDKKLKNINDKYIVEYDENTIFKVMDVHLNVLFEGQQDYDNIYYGSDDELYLYTNDMSLNDNIIELYRLENKEFKNVKTIMNVGIKYSALVSSNNILLGFVGLYDQKIDVEDQDIELNNYIYLLDDRELKMGLNTPVGDNKLNKDDVYTKSSRYIIISKKVKGKTLYGVYDMKEEKNIIEPTYTYMDIALEDSFVASNNGKLGIVDTKLKIKLDFSYDFIIANEDYYVLGKDDTISIMDKNYEQIMEVYYPNDLKLLTKEKNSKSYFKTFKIKGNYILEIPDDVELKGNLNSRYRVFVINETGVKLEIMTNDFNYDKDTGLIYSYDNEAKRYTIYNDDFSEKYIIDIKDYDYKEIPKLYLLNDETLVVDAQNELYFNYEDGSILEDANKYKFNDNKFNIEYDKESKKLVIEMDNQKKEYDVKSFNKNINLFKKDNGNYFIMYEDFIVSINNHEV